MLRSAIEKGVLTLAADGYVSFGIPSFHDYMMVQHRRVLDREAQRGRAGEAPPPDSPDSNERETE